MEHVLGQLSQIPAIPPAWILMLGGCVLPFLRATLLRNTVLLLLPVVVLTAIWGIPSTIDYTQVRFAGFFLNFYTIHPYTKIFATAFAIALFAGSLFALQIARITELTAALIYAGAAIGVTYSGDLISFFIYWEIMAIASTVIIACGTTERAFNAALRYVLLHMTGGTLMLAGIVGLSISDMTELSQIALTMDFHTLTTLSGTEQLSTLFIFIAILINAAAFPLSAWVADSYPEASPSGTIFLSAFTTKTSVFILLTLFAGSELLIPIGLAMIFYGILYAILENDMRRILAYSIVNQVGFMVFGIGIGTPLALDGVATHAFCHIIYKALLFMSAGSVLLMTGKRKCTDLGGLYHSMKLTTICAMIGALSISAFPLTSGFVSKSMIIDATLNQDMHLLWLLLIAASAGVFLHAGIKFPWFVFFQKDSGMRPVDPPLPMKLAMLLMALLCLLPGIAPEWLYTLLPQSSFYAPYSAHHVLGQLELLLFSGVAFFIFLPLLKRTETITLDFDWFYRVLLKRLLLLTGKFIDFILKQCNDLLIMLGQRLLNKQTKGSFMLTQTINITLVTGLMLFGVLLSQYWGLLHMIKPYFQ